jgi:DNA-binding MarR family transcriptional regulator
MYHTTVDAFVNNLLGTFCLAVSDALTDSVTEVAGHSGALGAAFSYLLQEPDCGIEDLRQPLRLSQPAAVRVVNQLVAAGLATRSENASDGRRVHIKLTRRGQTIARAILEARRRTIETMASSLTSEEQRTLASLLSKMLVATTEDRREAERICRLCDLDACPSDRCPVEAGARQAMTGPANDRT